MKKVECLEKTMFSILKHDCARLFALCPYLCYRYNTDGIDIQWLVCVITG